MAESPLPDPQPPPRSPRGWRPPTITSLPRERPTRTPGSFEARGFAGPFRLFEPGECPAVLARLRAAAAGSPVEWPKGFAAGAPQFHSVATRPEILERVAAMIGDDVVLWGAALTTIPPRCRHPWHSDVETAAAAGRTATVWIGLEHTDADGSLLLLEGSHRLGVPVQQAIAEIGLDVTRDEPVLAEHRRRGGTGRVTAPRMTDGEAIVFDGRLWHSSVNRLEGESRRALLLQYAAPDVPIRIPVAYDWPFRHHTEPRPPCLLVRGTAPPGVNRIVSPPPTPTPDFPPLGRNVEPLHLPLPLDGDVGWSGHGLFRGSTPNATDLGCHVSVLGPQVIPHAPHSHTEEELLVILEGEAELCQVDDDGGRRHHRLLPGAFVYYPAHSPHTLRCTGPGPVTYLMFRWRGPERSSQELSEPIVCDTDALRSPEPVAGFRARGIFEGSTRSLRKLHLHASDVAPGAGYAEHRDEHDVAIVMRSGEIETGGRRLGRFGVAFFPAGSPHGLTNPGEVPARYLVVEFHR